MNKNEWIRNLNATMEYYADFYGAKESQITGIYKKEIEQYADMMARTESPVERFVVMELFERAARSWAVEADEKRNRKYVMNNDDLVKSESVKRHLNDMAAKDEYHFRDKVDLDTMYQYAKGCNLYDEILTRNARSLKEDLIRT